MHGRIWFSKGTELSWISNYCISLVEIQSKVKTIVLTSSFIAILTISRAIIQSCMGGSGRFSKGTELSWISNYCISLVEIQSNEDCIVLTRNCLRTDRLDRRMHARRTNRHDISPSGAKKRAYKNEMALKLIET